MTDEQIRIQAEKEYPTNMNDENFAVDYLNNMAYQQGAQWHRDNADGHKDEIIELKKQIAALKMEQCNVLEITPKIPDNKETPHVTHEGEFEVFGEKFKVMVLNNGERVIEEEDAMKLFRHLGMLPEPPKE